MTSRINLVLICAVMALLDFTNTLLAPLVNECCLSHLDEQNAAFRQSTMSAFERHFEVNETNWLN